MKKPVWMLLFLFVAIHLAAKPIVNPSEKELPSTMTETAPLARFTLTEPLDRDWEPEWITRVITFNPGEFHPGQLLVKVKNAGAVESAFNIQSRYPDGTPKEVAVSVFISLAEGQTREVEIYNASQDSAVEPLPPVGIREVSDHEAILYADQIELRIPHGSHEYTQPVDCSDVPAPILAVRRKEGPWMGSGSLRGMEPVRSWSSETAVEGHLINTRITYKTAAGNTYQVAMNLAAHEPDVLISEEYPQLSKGRFELDLIPGLDPVKAHLAAHRTWAVKLDPANSTATYPINFQTENTLYLQPFYCWNDDIAFRWGAAGSSGEYLGIAPVHPSKWARPIYNRIQVTASPGPSLQVRCPLDRGTRQWLLVVCTENEARLNTDQTILQRQLVRRSDLPLQKILDMQLDWPGAESITHPRLLSTPADLPAIRAKVASDPEFSRLATQHRDKLDGYGVYLETGDETLIPGLKAPILNFLKTSLDWLITDGGGFSDPKVVAIGFHRPLRAMAMQYDAIASSTSITPEEKRSIQRTFAFLCYVFADRDYWPEEEQGFSRGNINFNSDMYSCFAAMAGLLGGHPRQPQWMAYVAKELETSLKTQTYPGGAWSECPLYHFVTLQHLVVTARILQLAGHVDMTQDPNLRATTDYEFRIQTPLDPRTQTHMTPTVGDTPGGLQGIHTIYAWVASLFRNNPEFSGRMMYAWEHSGRLVDGKGGWLYSLQLIDPSIPVIKPGNPLQNETIPGYGAILRNRWDQPDETYLLFKMGNIDQHFDPDEGSFHWYARGVPLSMDFGCMYVPSIDQPWYHSTIALSHQAMWNRGDIDQFHDLEGFSLASGAVTITNLQKVSENPGEPMAGPDYAIRRGVTWVNWRRGILLVKGPDYLILRDDIRDPKVEHPIEWSLPVLTSTAEITANRARFTGQFGTNLDVVFASPENIVLNQMTWGYTHADPREMQWSTRLPLKAWGEKQIILRAIAQPDQNHLACLYPYRSDEPVPDIQVMGPDVFRIRQGDRDDIVIYSSDIVAASINNVFFSGKIAVISRQKDKTVVNIIDGDAVKLPQIELHFQGSVTVEVSRFHMKGWTEGRARTCFLRWSEPYPIQPAELMLDGQPVPVYHTFDGHAAFTVPEGHHVFELSYPQDPEGVKIRPSEY